MLSFDKAQEIAFPGVSALGPSCGFLRVGSQNAGQLHHVSSPYYDVHRWLG
ncbi:hypothetical protein [Cupriavidus pinatubonensis]|uniref:Uncharacterized protein n=1 Tax=Cupriavidus pinatubonensis TaxID=248026 RepID=A0ABN7YW28_9BURK|nr:hypothetical protein [Cupriavidus pinatubonensis]CAG9175722.1 hypothetical protein LMG23994_03171 [Cupriavidus pinatubonensis]